MSMIKTARQFIEWVTDILDPERSPHRALLIWLAVLVAGSWVFLDVLEDVLTRDEIVFAGQSLYDSLQQLRTPARDRVMVAVTELGDAAVTVPLVIAVAVWFLIKRRWRDLAYWLAAIGGGVLIVAVLKVSLRLPRPVEIDSGISAYSFPSGHATMSAVVYGYLAAFTAKALSSRWRVVCYGVVVVLVGSIAFSRLYLGAHWLADVVAGLGIGSAWVALLTLARLRHEPEPAVPSTFIALLASVFLLAAGLHSYRQSARDLERYAVRHPFLGFMRYEGDIPAEWRYTRPASKGLLAVRE